MTQKWFVIIRAPPITRLVAMLHRNDRSAIWFSLCWPSIGFLTCLKLLPLAAKSQTSLDFARLHVTFRRWLGITFAMNIHWHASRTLARKMVMFKNRHHQNHSKQPGKQRKQDKICLSGAYTRCCYCVRSELFCPRCLNEQLFAANNSRPRDVALRLLSIRLL